MRGGGIVRSPTVGRSAALAALGLAGATLLSVGLLDGGPWRAVVVLLFLFLVPGWCVVRFFLPLDDALGLAVVVASSLAVVTLGALALLYSGTWQPVIGIQVLAAAAVASALHELRRKPAGAGDGPGGGPS